jgi:anti-sigma regulatory factor (Ser/Thr protein kinase)
VAGATEQLEQSLLRNDREDHSESETPMNTWHAGGGIGEVRQARDLVSRSLSDQPEATRDAAVLLVDECLANAVVHGGGRFEVTVHRDPDTLRVEVFDRSPRMPVLLMPDPKSERGRGLRIVNELAARWGADGRDDDGKVVWFELNLG